MHRRIITGYDHQQIEKLKATQKPFAYRLATFISDKDFSDITLQRVYVDFVIELEHLKEKYETELVEYKMRYGELN